MTNLNYPDRNVLPIFNGKVPGATIARQDCPATLLKKFCVSSPLTISRNLILGPLVFRKKKNYHFNIF